MSKVVPLAFDVGDALAASEVVSAFRVGGGQWEVAANTKVGVAAVSGVTLWIKPKVDIRRILFLLGYAKNPGWRADTVALAVDHQLTLRRRRCRATPPTWPRARLNGVVAVLA